jgi:hypothetical protein
VAQSSRIGACGAILITRGGGLRRVALRADLAGQPC